MRVTGVQTCALPTRAAHPGYWRRKTEPLEPNALQDDCIAQVVDDQKEGATLERFALQDDCIVQSPVLLGLISTLTGSALQDDIAVTCRGLHKQGRRILDARSGIFATFDPRTISLFDAASGKAFLSQANVEVLSNG